MRVGHQSVKFRPLFPRSADSCIHKFAYDGPSSPLAVFAQFSRLHRRILSVQEMADKVRELNNDKAVSRYYRMSDADRTTAELGDPALRAKVAALDALRGKLFDTISEAGGTDVGNAFREARKDWGALRSLSNQLHNDVTVPSPSGLGERIINSIRALRYPERFGARETLAQLGNPNRLVPKSLNMLGRSTLFPPEAPSLTHGIAEDADFYDLPPRRGLLGTSPLTSSEKAIPLGPSSVGADEFRSGAPTSSIVPQSPRLGLPEPSQIQLGRIENQSPQGLLPAKAQMQSGVAGGRTRVFTSEPAQWGTQRIINGQRMRWNGSQWERVGGGR